MGLMYKAVIFDFNGTLFFDNDKHIKAWGAISQQIRGHGISEEELHTHINGVPNKQVVQYLIGKDVCREELAKYSDAKEAFYRTYCEEDTASFHLVKGSIELFKYLKGHAIPFTIASASIKKNIDFFVKSFHLDTWIKPSDIIYDDGCYENKIAMFKDASALLKTDMRDILIVEDSIMGIQNAYEAGCNKIVVVNSADKKAEYEKFSNVIKVIDDLSEIIDM